MTTKLAEYVVRQVSRRCMPRAALYALLGILIVAHGPALAVETSATWPEITSENRPWAYWWWMGSAVNEADLTRQLETYRAAGMGGLHIVPIYGAKGYEDQFIDYLSPTWMERLGHTVREAQRLGLGVDMTTGTGWNFGGPTVTVADADATVVHNVYTVPGGGTLGTTFDPASTQALVAYSGSATVDLTGLIRPDGSVNWTAPSGTWNVHSISQQFSGRNVKRAAPGGAGRMINPFSEAAMTNYLVRFENALAGYSGPMPRGMYYDSYEYSSNWSPDLFAQFEARRGYRLQNQLHALFGAGSTDTVARVKSDYRRTVAEMIHENSIAQWDSWAGDRGMKTRYQAHGAPGNLLDLYAAADIPETEVFNQRRDILITKFASSAGHVMNKRLVAAETGTWLKEHFHETLGDMKTLVDEMFLGGVNHVFYHGTCYSPDEAAWPGWLFYASTQMNPRNSIWRDVPALNDYVGRAQSVLQSSAPDNDLLVYWPISDQWHSASGMQQNVEVISTGWFHDRSIGAVARTLWGRGYTFDYVSDNQLAQATASGGGVAVPGGNYGAIVVPQCSLMPEETLQRLVTLASGGATVIFPGGLPTDVPGFGNLTQRRSQFNSILATLQPTPVPGTSLQQVAINQGRFLIGDMESAMGISDIRRETLVDHAGAEFIRLGREGGNDYFVVNQGTMPMYKWITLSTPTQSALLMDPMTGETGQAAVRLNDQQQTEVLLHLERGQSMILRTFADENVNAPQWSYLRPSGHPVAIEGNWQVDFIQGGPGLPGSYQTTELGTWTGRGDAEADRFAGTARYRITFDAPAGAPEKWMLDLGQVAQSARVLLNGQPVGTLIGSPYRVALDTLQPTGNVLEVQVTNLTANRIRDLDRRGVLWKNFYDINFVDINYQPFDASNWPIEASGLLGPVRLWPMARNLSGTLVPAEVSVDSFGQTSIDAHWRQSTVLTQGAGATVHYDVTTNAGQLTWSYTDANTYAQQTVLLRDDFDLQIGDAVQVSMWILNPTGSLTQFFGGLAVDGVSVNPSNRGKLFAISAEAPGTIVLVVGNGTSDATLSDRVSLPTGYANGDRIDLRLTVTDLNTLQASYSVDGETFLNLGSPHTLPGLAALGLYNGNARSSAAGTIVFDDLKVFRAWDDTPDPMAGDINLDGRVNEADAVILARNWGTSGAQWTDGDLDGNGRVDAGDASILAANWGASVGEASALPEPTTPALAAALALAGSLFSRRRSGRPNAR